jgi:hypothetical protein
MVLSPVRLENLPVIDSPLKRQYWHCHPENNSVVDNRMITVAPCCDVHRVQSSLSVRT